MVRYSCRRTEEKSGALSSVHSTAEREYDSILSLRFNSRYARA